MSKTAIIVDVREDAKFLLQVRSEEDIRFSDWMHSMSNKGIGYQTWHNYERNEPRMYLLFD